MTEFVVTPEGRDAIEIGGFVDDNGERFVAMSFRRPNGDRGIVTLTTPLFKDFVGHVRHVAHAIADEDYWSRCPRG